MSNNASKPSGFNSFSKNTVPKASNNDQKNPPTDTAKPATEPSKPTDEASPKG
ncbi:MAG: hypothetical protein KBC57_05500 [Neisseriaceae bacterium]|nr:hypothetical protein [Neisseriaceae bacterium]MBP6861796.1 hypothetical protein [Neisseriaceae bacterium]